jgi:hypothetical protein
MRLLSGYQLSMMVLFAAGGYLTVRQEFTIAAGIATLIVLVSRYYRKRRHWRWPGIKPKDVLYALGGIVLMTFFLYAATPLFPPNDGQNLPWYLFGLGIGVFNVLAAPNLVCSSEAEFASHCMIIDQYGRELEPEPVVEPSEEISEPKWKRIIQVTYTVTFMLVWICSVASVYSFGTAFKNGSPQPTATQTEPLEDHSKTVYVTPAEKRRIHALQLVSWIGIPTLIIGGLVLHFLVGVKLFTNVPTLAEYLNRNKNQLAPPRKDQ